jgi:pyruvate/2-oxoglutarate/acetoin dehydrogenase E1 component/TPP-dependent pyruvate/acetoin dehydrogenase alpha subunit
VLENPTLAVSFIENGVKIMQDYKLAMISRECSMLVRKEVFSGRAKFGIYGDGKELANIALANAMQPGDFISGYYRDQTLVAAVGDLTWPQYFAQLYGHPDVNFEPHSGGRTMNNHHATRWLDADGHWVDQTKLYNSAAGVSSTAGQMPRSVGLAYASKLYRENPLLSNFSKFSKNGNEVCFATIGDASTSEGMFLECINAAGVLQIPLVMSVWDDGYGISVSSEYQTTKSSISKVLAGFQRNEDGHGLEIFTVCGWDYPKLIETYQKAANLARKYHIPSLIHVIELTQQQGHSASGSHERYKTKERLSFEIEYDCNRIFRNWILENGFADEKELAEIDENALKNARKFQKDAWQTYQNSILPEYNGALELIRQTALESVHSEEIAKIREELAKTVNPIHKDSLTAVKKVLRLLSEENVSIKTALKFWIKRSDVNNINRFSSHQTSVSSHSPLLEKGLKAIYSEDSPMIDGREILKKAFDYFLETNPAVFILGEDVGQIGDVNQSLAGLQEKFGELRVTDTGIREMTIVGQGIGAAMRGLKPIIEIQYLDYIFYPFATLSDDLACLYYRTVGGQKAPLIVRTRGHRLEGIWHSGSPMSVLIHGLRGMHICVPRNMVQAAGMYHTLIDGDDPALVIECLNGYRLKEMLPDNLEQIKVPLGMPEIIYKGTDVTIVTYGSMCRIVMEAAKMLENVGIFVEIIDVQTLLPFDTTHQIVESIKKTNRVIFADEDMPGGASSYMMQHVLETQNAWQYLDAKPVCLSAKPHRPAYTTDGDYFSKPNSDTIFEAAYALMQEAFPEKFPEIY